MDLRVEMKPHNSQKTADSADNPHNVFFDTQLKFQEKNRAGYIDKPSSDELPSLWIQAPSDLKEVFGLWFWGVLIASQTVFGSIGHRKLQRSIKFHRNSMDIHQIPQMSIKFHRYPSNSIDIHQIPHISIKFHRAPRFKTVFLANIVVCLGL